MLSPIEINPELRRVKSRRPERASSDRFTQVFSGAESHLLASLDFDRFARCRITAHARGAFANFESSQPGNANPCALFQMFANACNRFGENFVRLFLRNAVRFSDFRR